MPSETANTKDALPVLIVGAGPTGLTFACELARRGLEFRVIDKNAAATDKSKALGVHARTLEAFENIGVVGEALQSGIPAYGLEVYAHRQRVLQIFLKDLDSRYRFILMLPQSETERILSQRLAALGGHVDRQVELIDFKQDDAAVLVTLRHGDGTEESFRCRWLVGCDGAHSTVRHLLQLPFEGAQYPETFSLTDVGVEWEAARDRIIVYMSDSGPLAFFPMRDGRYRIIAATPQVDANQPPTLEEFQALVNQHVAGSVRLSDPRWLERFHIHRRRVDRYRVGRVFLAGDAGHIHSPAGGQGMNTGIQDAYNLAWKLALVESGAGRPQLLDSYHAERHPVAADVLKSSDIMTRLQLMDNPVGHAIREHLLPFLGTQEFIVHGMTRQISGTGVNYVGSPIVAEHRASLLSAVAGALTEDLAELDFLQGPRAGMHAPDADGLVTAAHQESSLYAAVRGTEHSLLLFAGLANPPEGLQQAVKVARAAADRFAARLNLYVVVPGPIDAVPLDIRALGDPRHALHKLYHAVAPCLYLIRPDGYIGFRAEPAEIEPLITYLEKILVPEGR